MELLEFWVIFLITKLRPTEGTFIVLEKINSKTWNVWLDWLRII
jgi:hypothetical protein